VEIPTFALAATERKLAERPDQVVRLLRAFVRALRTIQVEGEALTPLVAETFGYDEPVAAESLRLVLDAYSRDGALPEASLTRILAREGLDPSAVDGRFLARAQQDVAGHQKLPRNLGQATEDSDGRPVY
jgi:ABC-type nitrate/sulfonate/bicarbonate transport system substrate-binding protein